MRAILRTLCIVSALMAAVSQAGIPVTFQVGNPVKSGEVNANFAYLDSVTKAQSALIANLTTSLKDLQSKWSADSLAQSKKNTADSADLAALVLRNLPVGSVLGSMVPPGADGYLPGTNSTWVLAAGQDPVNGVKIPDLRGIFLRGIDYIVTGRAATGRDLDKPREAGHFQEDAGQDHSHWNGVTDDQAVAFPRGASSLSGTMAIQNENASAASFEGRTSLVIPSSARVASETRPKNAAVYWYFKVK